MERTQKRDHVRTTRVIPSQLQCALHRFCAGVAIEKPMWSPHRRYRRKLLRQIRQRLVIKIRARNVDQLCSLLLNRRNHLWMAMASRSHGDARGKIQKLIPVHVFYAKPASPLRYQRIRTRIAGRNQPVVRFHCGPCFRPGQGSNQLWSKLGVQFLFIHFRFSSSDSLRWLQMWSGRGPFKGLLRWRILGGFARAGEGLRRSGTNRRRRD